MYITSGPDLVEASPPPVSRVVAGLIRQLHDLRRELLAARLATAQALGRMETAEALMGDLKSKMEERELCRALAS